MLTSGAHKLDSEERTKDVYVSENINFEGLLLSEPTLTGLASFGFEKPSPIQYKAIPFGRCGFDLIAQAKSGTGKTCMFGVIALEMLQLPSKSLQVLILAPTREIAAQVADVITGIGKGHEGLQVATFIGGMPLEEDRRKARKCHIAVGSPGRMKQLIDEKILDIEHVRLVVLDEADKLLEPGFLEDINHIFSLLPESKQTLAASATYTDELKSFLENYMRSPIRVSPESLQMDGDAESNVLLGVRQIVGFVTFHPNMLAKFRRKLDALVYLLSCVPFKQCLVFNNLHGQAESMSQMLNTKGFPTEFISGHMEQPRRLKAIASLVEFKCRVLLSTDLSARGLDAANVDLVINMDIPQNEATYLHRVGRAGRFGSRGLVITLSENSGKDIEKLCNISSKINVNFDCFNININESLDIDLWNPENMVPFDNIINKKASKKIDSKNKNETEISKEDISQKNSTSSHLDIQDKATENGHENASKQDNRNGEKNDASEESEKENINNEIGKNIEAEKNSVTVEENIIEKSKEKEVDRISPDFHSAVDSSAKEDSESTSEESESEAEYETKEIETHSGTSEKESDNKTSEDEISDAPETPVLPCKVSPVIQNTRKSKPERKLKTTKDSIKSAIEKETSSDEITGHGDTASKLTLEEEPFVITCHGDAPIKSTPEAINKKVDIKSDEELRTKESPQYNYTPKSQQYYSGYQRNYNKNTYPENHDTPRSYHTQLFGNRYVYPSENPHLANYYAMQNSPYTRGSFNPQEFSHPRYPGRGEHYYPRGGYRGHGDHYSTRGHGDHYSTRGHGDHYSPQESHRGRGYTREYTEHSRLGENYPSRGNFHGGTHDSRPSFRTYDMTKSLARLFQDIRAYKLPDLKNDILGFNTLERLKNLYVHTPSQVGINENSYPRFHYTFLLTALRKSNGEKVIKTKQKFVKYGGTMKYLSMLADGYESDTDENKSKTDKELGNVNCGYATMSLTPFVRIHRSEWTLGLKVDDQGNVIKPAEKLAEKLNKEVKPTEEISKKIEENEGIGKKLEEEEKEKDSELKNDDMKKSPEELLPEFNESKIPDNESNVESENESLLYCNKPLEKSSSLESICATGSQASDHYTKMSEVDGNIPEEQHTSGEIPHHFNPFEYPPFPNDPSKIDLWKQQVKLTTFMIHYGKYMQYMYAPKE